MRIQLPNRFAPRRYQLPLLKYLDGGGKRAFVVWPRRHGKDLTAAHYTAKASHEKVGLYWHFFPTLEWGRRALWEAFTPDGRRTLDWVFPGFSDPGGDGIVARKNDQQMFLEFKNGSIWRVMGSDKIESVGAGPIGVVWSEYAAGKPRAWNLVRPMLRENGGWSLFITTPRGNNHAKKLYDDAKSSGWYTDHKNVYETGQTFFSEIKAAKIGPDEMMAEERASGMPDALVRQEYLTDWSAANVGAVFGDLLPERVHFGHPPDGVYTSWDLGISDATAIWFWRLRGDGVEFIDHIEATGKPFSFFADEVERLGYKYVRHYLPHDARSRTAVTMVTYQDAAEERWRGKIEITPSLSLADGIQAGRWLLQRADTRFHTRCEQGHDALRAYHYEWDEDRKTLARLPLHDWSSHTADAFRYAATVARWTLLVDGPKERPAPEPEVDATPPTFDDMARAAMRRKPRREHV